MARILLALLLSILLVMPAAAGKRVALVIGNAAYENAVPLKNPHNDAADMAAALERLGFEVVSGTDLTYDGMRDALKRFSASLVGAEVALFFYAGHAVQVNGANYLAPIDTDLERQSDLDFETIPLDLVQRQMEAEAKTLLVFLDACRNNPLTRRLVRLSRSLDSGAGLAQPRASPLGIFVAFATAPGEVALDGEGRNSPFTTALLNHIERPGVEISALMTDVRRDVFEATGNTQRPWSNTSLIGRFYFREGAHEAPSAVQAAPAATPDAGADADLAALERERNAWARIRTSVDPADIRAFLAEFPDGMMSAVAQFKLEQLDETLAAEKDDGQQDGQQLAALQQPQAPSVDVPVADETADEQPDEGPVTEETVRSIQAELNRLGCNAGRPDGKWGRNSAAAVERFGKHGSVQLASTDPSHGLLDRLKQRDGRVCPLVCSVRQIERDGQCVAKTCPAGQRLSSKGQCYTPRRTAASGSAPRASNCVKIMGETICD